MALTLVLVSAAPAAPAGAYPYGRYFVKVDATDQCLTLPFNGAPGTYVIRSHCTSVPGNRAIWHFDRVDTYWGDPVFEIRATGAYGELTDCLDLPYGDVYAGRPIWSHPCNGGNAQRWRQMPTGTTNEHGEPLYRYVSMSAPDSGWVMQFNNTDVYPHLVMVPASWSPYQMFSQVS